MSLLDLGSPPPKAPTLVADPVWLRPIRIADFAAWTGLREESRAHLTRWEPAWRPEEMTETAFRQRVRAHWREMRRGGALPLIIFRRGDNKLLGAVTLSNIRYGAARSAVVGYWIGAPYLRQGYARAGLTAMLDYAFSAMGLNRIEAACQPENEPSLRLLEGVGFKCEGRARAYLNINDNWRDHLLYAIIAGDYRAACENA
ncbi:MAG TPA: GNAT family protein [Parvularculaceae bacterium]|nr:GNAT family protein [Parvularculaceae bacterium]